MVRPRGRLSGELEGKGVGGELSLLLYQGCGRGEPAESVTGHFINLGDPDVGPG